MQKRNWSARVYPVETSMPKLRTQKSLQRQALKAEESGNVYRGVKGQSILFLLSFFTFPVAFVIL